MNFFTQCKPLTLLLSIAPVLSLVAALVASRAKRLRIRGCHSYETNFTNVLLTATDKQNRNLTLRRRKICVCSRMACPKTFTFRETDRLTQLHCDRYQRSENMLEKSADARLMRRLFVEQGSGGNHNRSRLCYLEQGLTPNVLAIYQPSSALRWPCRCMSALAERLAASVPGRHVANPREGSAAIWDAVTVSAGEILTQSGQRRRAIILLTDRDTSSRVTKSGH